jgi:hypothetical protein
VHLEPDVVMAAIALVVDQAGLDQPLDGEQPDLEVDRVGERLARRAAAADHEVAGVEVRRAEREARRGERAGAAPEPRGVARRQPAGREREIAARRGPDRPPLARPLDPLLPRVRAARSAAAGHDPQRGQPDLARRGGQRVERREQRAGVGEQHPLAGRRPGLVRPRAAGAERGADHALAAVVGFLGHEPQVAHRPAHSGGRQRTAEIASEPAQEPRQRAPGTVEQRREHGAGRGAPGRRARREAGADHRAEQPRVVDGQHARRDHPGAPRVRCLAPRAELLDPRDQRGEPGPRQRGGEKPRVARAGELACTGLDPLGADPDHARKQTATSSGADGLDQPPRVVR